MYLIRGASPLAQMIPLEKNPLQQKALHWFGSARFQDMPYEELYFLDLDQQMRRAMQMLLVYLGGVSSAAGMRPVMDEGYDFIAMGRALLQGRNVLQRAREQGEAWVSPYTHCNQCVASMALLSVLDEHGAFAI